MGPLASGLKDEPAPAKKDDAAVRAEEKDAKDRAKEREQEEKEKQRREQERKAARVEQKRTARLGEAALKEVEALAKEAAAYDTEVAKLKADDRGKSIAADKELVRLFRAAAGKDRAGAAKAGELRET